MVADFTAIGRANWPATLGTWRKLRNTALKRHKRENVEYQIFFPLFTLLTGFRHPRQTGFFMHPGPSIISGSERKASPGDKFFDAIAAPSFINVSFTILCLTVSVM